MRSRTTPRYAAPTRKASTGGAKSSSNAGEAGPVLVLLRRVRRGRQRGLLTLRLWSRARRKMRKMRLPSRPTARRVGRPASESASRARLPLLPCPSTQRSHRLTRYKRPTTLSSQPRRRGGRSLPSARRDPTCKSLTYASLFCVYSE